MYGPKFVRNHAPKQGCHLYVPRRHAVLVCGIYFIKSLHRDKKRTGIQSSTAFNLVAKQCGYTDLVQLHIQQTHI